MVDLLSAQPRVTAVQAARMPLGAMQRLVISSSAVCWKWCSGYALEGADHEAGCDKGIFSELERSGDAIRANDERASAPREPSRAEVADECPGEHVRDPVSVVVQAGHAGEPGHSVQGRVRPHVRGLVREGRGHREGDGRMPRRERVPPAERPELVGVAVPARPPTADREFEGGDDSAARLASVRCSRTSPRSPRSPKKLAIRMSPAAPAVSSDRSGRGWAGACAASSVERGSGARATRSDRTNPRVRTGGPG